MSRISNKATTGTICALLLFGGLPSMAWSKLPPPTEEQAAKAEAAKQKAAEDAAKEKVLLEKAQDRVASRYIADQKAKGITVVPTPLATASAVKDPRTEVPSAAINSRPTEKAGAYNEAVTPQTAHPALQGDKGQSATTSQEKQGPTK